MTKIDEFERMTRQLKMKLSVLPTEKIEKLFRHHQNFTLLSYRHIKLLTALADELTVEKWQNFDEQLGMSALDFILQRSQNVELLLTQLTISSRAANV